MKFKGFWYDSVLLCLVAGISAAFIAMTVFIEPRLAVAECVAFLIVFAVAVYRALSAGNRYKRFLIKTSKKLDFTDEKVLSNFPFPVAVCDETGSVIWRSQRFMNEISPDKVAQTDTLEMFTNGLGVEELTERGSACVQIGERYYTCLLYTSPSPRDS